jgi:hypothetical protein
LYAKHQIKGETIAKVFGKVDTFWTYQKPKPDEASKDHVILHSAAARVHHPLARKNPNIVPLPSIWHMLTASALD